MPSRAYPTFAPKSSAVRAIGGGAATGSWPLVSLAIGMALALTCGVVLGLTTPATWLTSLAAVQLRVGKGDSRSGSWPCWRACGDRGGVRIDDPLDHRRPSARTPRRGGPALIGSTRAPASVPQRRADLLLHGGRRDGQQLLSPVSSASSPCGTTTRPLRTCPACRCEGLMHVPPVTDGAIVTAHRVITASGYRGPVPRRGMSSGELMLESNETMREVKIRVHEIGEYPDSRLWCGTNAECLLSKHSRGTG